MSDNPRLPSAKELIVLDLLSSEREMYGLEMVKSSNCLARGAIYVMLYRMEDKGYVTSRQVKDKNASGMPKRLYAITEWGNKVLEIARRVEAAFHQAATAVAPGPRPSRRKALTHPLLSQLSLFDDPVKS
jgi:DNA-binding PadR family transcriptional regulator